MGTSQADDTRRWALFALIAIVALFLTELVALVMGWFSLAVICGALLIVSWFVMRSIVKRRDRANETGS